MSTQMVVLNYWGLDAVFSPVYFKRLNLRGFSEQFPLINHEVGGI